MATFALDRRFRLVFCPFRAFQALLTPEDQRTCLACAHAHLEPGARLILDLFDPKIEWLGKDATHPAVGARDSVRHPRNGNEVRVEILGHVNDPLTQTFVETWRHEEVDAAGRVLRREEEELRLRWTYAQEMRYLLELTGFAVEDLWSDFRRSPPSHGREQVWVARRR
jgi:hypothetical protein